MIEKTDAIVLKSMRYRDTSRIVTFYTRQYGKLKAIAKGARDLKSKFGASLEPMTLSSLVLYKKEHRELQLVSQCDIIRQYKRIHSDIGRMAVALSVVELVNQLTHDEEENHSLFTLLVRTLDTLERAERMFEGLFYAFEIRLALLFGFGLHLEKCVSCGKRLEFSDTSKTCMLNIGKGGVYCASCASTAGVGAGDVLSRHKIRAETAGMLKMLTQLELDSIQNLEYSADIGNEVGETLRLYLQYHVEGLKPLKSAAVFHKMNDDAMNHNS